jgi:hypothetical protein
MDPELPPPPSKSNAKELLDRGCAPGRFGIKNLNVGWVRRFVKLGCGEATGAIVVVAVTVGALDVVVGVGVEGDSLFIITALPTLEDTTPGRGTGTGVVEGFLMRNEALLGGALPLVAAAVACDSALGPQWKGMDQH